MQKRLLSRKRAENSSSVALPSLGHVSSKSSKPFVISNSLSNSSSNNTINNSKNDWSMTDNFIMDRCGLPCLPSFKGREGVQFISLQHNLIGRIDSSLASFRMLKVLNLYDNKIERISGLDNLLSLKVLMLGKNRLKSTEGLESLLSLDILDLHGNQICSLTGLSRLQALRVLNVAANMLKKLTPLDGLSSLEELNARRNRITKIAPEVLANSRRLERLYLSNNELRRLDDLSGLLQLNSLKELSLDGNPVTLISNYVLNCVASLPSLVLLDQNVISIGLRHEAESWSLRSKRPNSMTRGHGRQYEPVKVAPLVTVSPRKTRRGSSASAASTPKLHRNVAIVRPLSATGLPVDGLSAQSQEQQVIPFASPLSQEPSTETQTVQGPTLNPQLLLVEPTVVLPAKSCMFRADQQQYPAPRKSYKSFRQIAFSAMLCRARPTPTTAYPNSATGGNGNNNMREKPVFRFNIRPPTAEWNERKARGHSSRRPLTAGRNHDVDLEIESSSSWGSDESDDDDTASTLSTSSVKLPVVMNNNQSNKANRSSVISVGARVITPSTLVSSSRGSIKSFTQSQKLSATIGMNIKEQLRDLRIIVSDEEIHIGGLNVIRMLHNLNWTADEVEPFRTLVFHGLGFDQLAPFYAPLRALFPNLRHFVFRKGPTAPLPRHINAFGHFESSSTHRWITQLNVESPACCSETTWHLYAIYRLYPFGLEVIDGREISPSQLIEAEDQYSVLDSLALLTAPGSVAANRRQLERISSALDRHHGSTSSSSSVSGSSTDGGSTAAVAVQHTHNKEHENALLLKKRAIRNFFQIPKDGNRSQMRNRLPNLHYVAEYGMEIAVKLSILQENWDHLLKNMVLLIGQQVADEETYRRERLGSLKIQLPPHKQQHQ